MKQLFWAILMCFALNAETQTRSLKDFTGIWLAVNENDAGLEVIDSNTVFLIYGSQRKAAALPVFDFSKSLIRFNFTVKDDQQNLSMKSLLLFVNDDLLQWQIFDGVVQPLAFSSNQGDLMFLRRKK